MDAEEKASEKSSAAPAKPGASGMKINASSVKVKVAKPEPEAPSKQPGVQNQAAAAHNARQAGSPTTGEAIKVNVKAAAAEPVQATSGEPDQAPASAESQTAAAQETASQEAVPPPAPAPAQAPEEPRERKKGWFDGDPELIQEDLDYMSSAAAAVLQQSPRGGQQLLWAICIFAVVAVTWSALAYVDEFTRGEGKVIPSSQVQVIQNLEGGIIAELYVRVGQTVEAGQELLRIDDTQFSSSLREADVTLEQLKAKNARLQYEADGEAFPDEPIDGVSVLVWSQEEALYRSRKNEQDSKNQVLVQQVTQRKQELNELRAKRDHHQRSFNLLDQELQMSRPLVSSGAMSEVELLRLERQVNDLDGELRGAQLAIPRAESSLQEARDKLNGTKLSFRNESRNELADVRLELQRLSESSGALQDRVQRTLVTSPMAGTIKQVLVSTIGGVIQPGMNIIEIVPTEDRLFIESKIRPADIAFLHPGQEAIVKFTAYDFSIHGGLKGTVVHISPDTIVDEEGVSFYLVRVETEKGFLGDEESPLPIIPGMTVSVDVLTGKKTVLDYILKPILKTKQLALRER